MSPGTVITELKGSMANLTEEEDRELKRTDLRNCDIRRDFSVIHSKQMKKNHLFLGPARFVNVSSSRVVFLYSNSNSSCQHDCDNNCELFREGKYITFRVLRPIAIGDEITAHYGDGYCAYSVSTALAVLGMVLTAFFFSRSEESALPLRDLRKAWQRRLRRL